VRATILVLLLTLALGGCAVRVVPGREGPPPGSDTTSETSTVEATTVGVSDTTVDSAPGSTDDNTRSGDEQTAVRVVNAFWEGWFAEQGRRYVPPRVSGGYTGRNGPRCAGEPSVPGNAFYCPSGNFLAWDENLMRAGYEQIGDAWVYLVIAHEWGHAIQAQLPDRLVSQALELQADCLAGASLQGAADQNLVRIEPGDAQEIQRTLVAVADDFPWTDEYSHGDAQQRIGAFRTGAQGGVDACLRS
jgi:predicted metalloprotease